MKKYKILSLFLIISTLSISCYNETKSQNQHIIKQDTMPKENITPSKPKPKVKDFSIELVKLKNWEAGQIVSHNAVEMFGLENCFLSEEIPENIWQKMQGKTYVENPNIQRSDLRHIRALHYDYDKKIHIGEMICNKKIAEKLVNIFKELYQNQYPIEKMLLPEEFDADDEKQMQANNSSCFCYRNVPGTKRLSKHSLGLAVDINTLYNPYITYPNGNEKVRPENATEYCDRSKNFKYKIENNDLCVKLFRQNGFIWGGTWRSRTKDYQHFDTN